MKTRFRFAVPLAFCISALAYVDTARAFDVEDYYGTLRATRDAWLRALHNVRIQLPRFLAIRQIAESYGLNVADQDLPLGAGLRPAWCENWNGEAIGHPFDIGLGNFAFSGSFDFYGRGHGLHGDGKGLGHHHHATAPGLSDVVTNFFDEYDAIGWYDSIIPGSSTRASQLASADLAWYEAHGAVKQHCQVCEPCPPDGPCDANIYFSTDEPVDFQWNTYEENCWTPEGQIGHWRAGECPATIQCDDGHCCAADAVCRPDWSCEDSNGNPAEPTECQLPMTVEQALTLFAGPEYGFPMATEPTNMCWPEWWDREDLVARVFTTYRAHRDSMVKSLHEVNLATAPFRAATAAYAAAVEVFYSNTSCATWILPNIPDLPNPFESTVQP